MRRTPAPRQAWTTPTRCQVSWVMLLTSEALNPTFVSLQAGNSNGQSADHMNTVHCVASAGRGAPGAGNQPRVQHELCQLVRKSPDQQHMHAALDRLSRTQDLHRA